MHPENQVVQSGNRLYPLVDPQGFVTEGGVSGKLLETGESMAIFDGSGLIIG